MTEILVASSVLIVAVALLLVLRERIVRTAKKPGRVAGTLAAMLVIVPVAVGCTFTGAQTEETPEPTPTVETQSPSPSPTEPDNSAVLVDDFSYTGIHRDVTYYPDAPADGSEFDESTARTYTIVLCQPVTQGEGGIWCVERWYDDQGERHFVLPDTDLPAEEFYAQCQAQADATGSTGSSWADLDINWVLLNFVTDTFHVSNFSSREGSDYLADRGGTRETGTQPAASTDLEQALEELLPEGSTAVLTLERHNGEEITYKTVTADPDRLGMGLDWRDWSYADAPAEEPECDAAIYLSGTSEPADAVSQPAIGDDDAWMKFYEGSGLIRRHTDGTDIWYYVKSGGEEYDVGAKARFWYDDAEYTAALAITVTPRMLEEARDKYDISPVDDDPAHQDFALVARVWSEQLAENMRNLEPDSFCAVLDAQVYSADVAGPDDYYAPEPGVDDSFVFFLTMAIQVPNPEQTPYQAGSGLWEIAEGPYAGWYGWGMGRYMEKQGDNWVSTRAFNG